VSAGARDAWLIAESEYFLKVANEELQLAGNVELATVALEQADDRLTELDDPIYTPVRSAIADELARLELVAEDRNDELALTLASLSRVVDSLPVQRLERPAAEESGDTVIDTDQNGFQRAWSAVKDSMSGAIRITKTDGDASPLLTPDAETLLRANLSLQLQAARLALLRDDNTIFLQSLDDADSWLANYFDTESVQVQSARSTIAEIRGSRSLRSLPDISESLRLLRQTRVIDEGDE